MTETALRFDHRDKKDCACYRPIDYSLVHGDPARGPSLLVNGAFVSEYLDNGGFSYCKSVGDHRDRGPSLLVNRTFVSEYFRGMDPKNTSGALILGNVSAGRSGVGE